MTIISVASSVRRHARHSLRGPGRPGELTPLEARLLLLRPGGGGALPMPPAASRRRMRKFAQRAFWLSVLAALGIGYLFIDRGGGVAPLPSAVLPSFSTTLHGSGRVPVVVPPGDISVRVNVAAQPGAGLWFWCLESSLGLPPAEHICRDSSASGPGGESALSGGVVHVDAASVQDAALFVQMYCRDTCDWQAEVKPVRQTPTSSR